MNLVGNRRAISTVITTVFMLTAVAVMGATLVAWSNGKLIVFESSLANSAANKTNAINENLSIENVVFCSHCTIGPPANLPGINVTLTNTGTLAIKVNQILINGSNLASSVVCNPLPATIYPKQSYLWMCYNWVWHSKSVNTIAVTTARGSIFSTQAAPP